MTSNCDCTNRWRPDWMLLISALVVLPAWILGWLMPGLPEPVARFAHSCHDIMGKAWWGLLLGVFAVGLLARVPRSTVLRLLGPGGSLRGLLRALMAGVLLDLCSHGILAVGMKLYERGASSGQVMAFLIASPWNSISLTLILAGLIGWSWTLSFVGLSLLVGLVSGWVVERLVATGRLPGNPHADAADPVEQRSDEPGRVRPSPGVWLFEVLRDGIVGSRVVLRWILFGTALAAAIHVLLPDAAFANWFGPTLFGLLATSAAATVIEVCSEGSVPIAADLFNRGGAPGNAFAFLMAGVATDYTELMSLRDTTDSWRIAFALPLVTLPQVLPLAILLNALGGVSG